MKKFTCALALLIAASSFAGCAREGFKDSLGQRENLDPVKVEASKDMSESEEPSDDSHSRLEESLYIEFEPKIVNEPNLYIAYSLPKKDGYHDEVCDIITASVEETLDEVVSRFDISKEGSYINIYDAVGAITEDIVSLFYEGEYMGAGMKEPSFFAFGLNYNARTGGQYTISEIMKPHTMATLIMDEQSSRILGKEEKAKKKREEISKKGMSSLADRIIAADSQKGVDNLFAFSFYLEKGNLVAIVPMDDDTMEPAYIELMNDKV